MLRISLLLLLGQKISTGGLLLALGGGVQAFPRKRGGELYGRMERAAEGRVRTCGRRWGRGAYIEVEYGGEAVGRGEVRM